MVLCVCRTSFAVKLMGWVCVLCVAFPLRKGGNFGLRVFYVSVYVGNSRIYGDTLILSRPNLTHCVAASGMTSASTPLNTRSLNGWMLYSCWYIKKDREFVLVAKRMLKNRNTVEGGSTKQIKQTVIMVCVVLPSKMLNVYTEDFLGMTLTREAWNINIKLSHSLILIAFLLIVEKLTYFIWTDLDVTNCCNCKSTFS